MEVCETIKLQIPRLEITADEAKAIMEREGKEIIKDDGKRAHIWMSGTSNYCISEFDLEREVVGPRWRIGPRGPRDDYVATGGRGWRTKDWETFTRVSLIYVGKKEIQKAYEEEQERQKVFRGLDFWGTGLTLYPMGVPDNKANSTLVEDLEEIEEPERFRRLFRGYYSGDTRKVQMNGVDVELESDGVVGLFLKTGIEQLKGAFKESAYQTLHLSDLSLFEADSWSRSLDYSKDENSESPNFSQSNVDKAVRVLIPRKTRSVPAKVKIEYPDHVTPLIMSIDESIYALVVAAKEKWTPYF
ncbi:hypothetical protein MUP77_01360 [Candidatus Bathyarchaeota archaeon]|nr:hypothetical protein [Candidatus Bathyarchaeota archaeon]